jgi:hypothetical protein
LVLGLLLRRGAVQAIRGANLDFAERSFLSADVLPRILRGDRLLRQCSEALPHRLGKCPLQPCGLALVAGETGDPLLGDLPAGLYRLDLTTVIVDKLERRADKRTHRRGQVGGGPRRRTFL